MKRTLNTTINRSKSEKYDEYYAQLADVSSFAFNDRSEVVSAAIGTNLFTHAYDDIGNQLLFGDNAVTNTYTHNNLNQITTSLCPPASSRRR